MNLNKVHLIGRLTRDPEMRTTQGGQTVTTVSLATGRTWTDKSGQKQEQTEYHRIVLWGRVAEIAGQYLVKGQEAYFEGRLQTTKYTGKDGVERYTTEIIAEQMQLGQKPAGASSGNGGYNRPAPAQATQKSQSKPAEDVEEIPTINLDDEKDDIKIEEVPF
jgi:single-strand DNA-binding protein